MSTTDEAPAAPADGDRSGRAARRRRRPRPRRPDAAAAWPAEKSMNFGPSAKRLLGRMRPERPRLIARRSLLAVVSVGARA